MGRPVVHWELMSKDPAKVSDFYARIFDWNRRKIVDAGGEIHVEEQEVPGMGWLSLFTDPEGRMMGLWKPKAKSGK